MTNRNIYKTKYWKRVAFNFQIISVAVKNTGSGPTVSMSVHSNADYWHNTQSSKICITSPINMWKNTEKCFRRFRLWCPCVCSHDSIFLSVLAATSCSLPCNTFMQITDKCRAHLLWIERVKSGERGGHIMGPARAYYLPGNTAWCARTYVRKRGRVRHLVEATWHQLRGREW